MLFYNFVTHTAHKYQEENLDFYSSALSAILKVFTLSLRSCVEVRQRGQGNPFSALQSGIKIWFKERVLGLKMVCNLCVLL